MFLEFICLCTRSCSGGVRVGWGGVGDILKAKVNFKQWESHTFSSQNHGEGW